MRNTMILLVLISLGLVAPALADGRKGGWDQGWEQTRAPRVEREHRARAHHDRGDNYGHFRQRMRDLRKELRHERRENRRLERRIDRREIRHHRRDHRRDYRRHYRPTPVVVVPRPAHRAVIFPQLVVRIPLNW